MILFRESEKRNNFPPMVRWYPSDNIKDENKIFSEFICCSLSDLFSFFFNIKVNILSWKLYTLQRGCLKIIK